MAEENTPLENAKELVINIIKVLPVFAICVGIQNLPMQNGSWGEYLLVAALLVVLYQSKPELEIFQYRSIRVQVATLLGWSLLPSALFYQSSDGSLLELLALVLCLLPAVVGAVVAVRYRHTPKILLQWNKEQREATFGCLGLLILYLLLVLFVLMG